MCFRVCGPPKYCYVALNCNVHRVFKKLLCLLETPAHQMGNIFHIFFLKLFFCRLCILLHYFPVRVLYPEPRTRQYEIRIYHIIYHTLVGNSASITLLILFLYSTTIKNIFHYHIQNCYLRCTGNFRHFILNVKLASTVYLIVCLQKMYIIICNFC